MAREVGASGDSFGTADLHDNSRTFFDAGEHPPGSTGDNAGIMSTKLTAVVAAGLVLCGLSQAHGRGTFMFLTLKNCI
jgi:hypothetical protein